MEHSFLYTYRWPLALTVAIAGAWYLTQDVAHTLGTVVATVFILYIVGSALWAYHYGRGRTSHLHAPAGGIQDTENKHLARIIELEKALTSEREVVAAMSTSLSPDDFSQT